MIRNSEELQVVRSQLARAEEALASLRRDVFPKSEKTYRVMSEAYVDTIHELRGHVDSYLGIQSIPTEADLTIALEGEGVGLGQISASLVTRFIDAFRRGVQSAVELVEAGARPSQGRRRERWIERICDLQIVGLSPGSVRVLLSEPADRSLFSDENRESLDQALDLVFEGLHWAGPGDADDADHDEPFSRRDAATRQAVLAIVTQLLPPRSGDIARVRFGRRGLGEDARYLAATLTQDSRGRIKEALSELVHETQFREIEGVIRKLDLDDRSFALRDCVDGEGDLRCEYGPELEDAVKEYLDCRVLVTGTFETNRKQKAKMLADSIELIDEVDVGEMHMPNTES